MATQPNAFLTPEEYLAIDRAAEFRSEYHNGEMFAMSGSSLAHNRIVRNLVRDLGDKLRDRRCEVFSNDFRLAAGPSYTYPDVVVVCGEPILADDQQDILTNPVLIVEVLSKSTANYDQGGKFNLYKRIPSFQEYLTIAQDEILIYHSIRQSDNSWLVREIVSTAGQISLPSIGLDLQLADIYENVF